MSRQSLTTIASDQRRWLLRLARSTIEARLAGRPLPNEAPPDGPLTEARGAFVTLTAGGSLRGCIGHVVGVDPLWLSVRVNAVNAALHDPRFPPVGRAELAGLAIEISALTPLRRVAGPADIVVGRDGIVIERGAARGLLLPQVGERYGWTAAEFLDQTCRKAGLRPGCWREADSVIWLFSAEVFDEAGEG
jgi:AmmeMemoRadiSam system protein A